MSKLRIESYSVSVDGFGAGPDQTVDAPMGVGGMGLHTWAFATPTFRGMHDFGDAAEAIDGVDESFAKRGFDNIGAWILGRNMFGPVRGPWPDDSWRGWWGENPPYHCDIYVLTHYPRAPLVMDGGNTFHFVTDGLDAAVKSAFASANGKDVRLGGGASTIRQAFEAKLVDEAHLAISPVVLGRGEAVFAGLDLPALGYSVTQSAQGENAMHIILTRNAT